MASNNHPKYSVLMSVYWKEKSNFLDFAIKSMLDQTVKPSEFVIIEDGELTPELYDIINKYTIKYPNLFRPIQLSHNVGLGPALRRGIKECSNELIARMDSDDYCKPNRIERQLEMIQTDPKLGMVGTNVEEFENNPENIISHVVLPETNEQIVKYSKTRCPFRHPSLLYKKSAVLKAKNYREFYLCEDYDLYVRMIRSGCKCYNIQEPLTYMRISPDFYKRRGGVKYMRTILNFKNEQLRLGYFSRLDYIKSVIPHIVVCLMPNAFRDYTYRHLLRRAKNV